MKAIIFDFGNVVGFFDFRRALERLAPHTDLTLEQVRALLVGSKLEDDYESGRLTSDEFLYQLASLCRFRCDRTLLAEAFADIFWPNPDVTTLLPRLKGRYRLLLGSNTNDLHARQFRQQFADSLAHFHELVLSYEIGARKPKAAFFEHCQRLAGCPAGECVFIDDLPANIAGAEACGLKGIIYTDIVDLNRRLRELGVEI
jgi:putative hydrolase of the HAD superfamily